MKSKLTFIFFIVICIFAWTQALKCKTEDGHSDEDIRQIVKTCMKKIGENLSNNNKDYDNSDYDESKEMEENYKNRNRDYLKGRQGRYKRENYDNFHGGRQYYQDDQNYYNNRQFNGTNNDEKRSEHDRSCIMHCFLQEMKMTGEDGFPDKHKVIHVMVKDVRDRQLKNFFTDSIQECFHLLDMEYRRDKCDFSRNLLTCLNERAKNNCEDWNNTTIVL